MRIGYIKEQKQEKELPFIEKLIRIGKKMGRVITIQEKESKYFFLIPFCEKEEDKIKIMKKLNKQLEKRKITKVLLSTENQNNKQIQYLLESLEKGIIEGKEVFPLLEDKVLEYLMQKLKIEEKEMELTILINELNKKSEEYIEKLAMRLKRVNIITNHMEKFRPIAKKLYEDGGIIVTISNNKRKSLAKSEIIFNKDFPEELVNQYSIYSKAIIVNFQDKIRIKSKIFQGLNISDYNISWQRKEQAYDKDFKGSAFYESLLWQSSKKDQWEVEIEKDKVKLEELIGNNGPILEEEYKNFRRNA